MNTPNRDPWRIVKCAWCGTECHLRSLQEHFANQCPVCPHTGPICSRCQKCQTVDDFPKHAGKVGGRDFTCNTCHREAATKCNNAKTRKTGRRWGFVTCRWCNAEIFKKEIRAHLIACPQCPACGPNEKICSLCQSPVSRSNFPKHQREPDGLGNCCKPCTQQRSNDWWKDPAHRTDRMHFLLNKNYGLSRDGDEYEAVLAMQGGRCAICGRLPSGGPKNRRLHADHDHVTGKFRALLCNHCNPGLGHFHDDVALMIQAICFITDHRPLPTVS